jgi:Domain of unknown function (DUF4383)
MISRYFALTIGIVYVLLAVLGFFPPVLSAPPVDAPPLSAHTGYGDLFGLFPVNVLHNVLHLAVGIWALFAYRSVVHSINFARGLAMIFVTLAVMGVLPWASTAFGLVPLFGPNVWLHALTAASAAYIGYSPVIDAAPVELSARRSS